MKYQDFSVEDFLKDDFFVRWVKNKDPESDHFWLKWIENHPEKAKSLLAARQIILSLGYTDFQELSDEEYTDILEGVVKETGSYGYTHTKSKWYLKLAAAIILILLTISSSYWLLKTKGEYSQTATKYITKSNPQGQKTTIRLSDNSVITLNAQSFIKFPENFSTQERVIHLQGEAFFKVSKDAQRPFKVITGDVVTEVLGTSFNIKSDSILNEVEIALVEGSVSVSDKKGNSFMLQPHEMVKYAPDNIEKSLFDHDQIVGWVHGKLVFHKATSQEVINKLENWYGVEFRLVDGPMFNDVYSGVFINEPLKNVLDGIGYTWNFEYSIDDKTIIIKH